MKILVIEDDRDIAHAIKDALADSYTVELAFTGEVGQYQAEIYSYDLIILDLGLPDIDGALVCRDLRTNNIKVPILILTAEDDVTRKVNLLDFGADDYLTKPFHLNELKARLRTLLRRSPDIYSQNVLSIADLEIDLNTGRVSRGPKEISLRRKEFHLLEYLARNAGRIITRNMILDHIWDSFEEPMTNIIDVHIKHLREKVDKPFSQKLIKTVHGLGYMIKA